MLRGKINNKTVKHFKNIDYIMMLFLKVLHKSMP